MKALKMVIKIIKLKVRIAMMGALITVLPAVFIAGLVGFVGWKAYKAVNDMGGLIPFLMKMI